MCELPAGEEDRAPMGDGFGFVLATAVEVANVLGRDETVRDAVGRARDEEERGLMEEVEDWPRTLGTTRELAEAEAVGERLPANTPTFPALLAGFVGAGLAEFEFGSLVDNGSCKGFVSVVVSGPL